MVIISICQTGSSLAQSICFRKVEFYQHIINLSPLVLRTGSPKTVHVFSCLCDNTYKRSCPVSRLLPFPIQPACADFDCFVGFNHIPRQHATGVVGGPLVAQRWQPPASVGHQWPTRGVLSGLMSLFSTCRPYRERQKPANGTQCPTLSTDSQGSFTCIITQT